MIDPCNVPEVQPDEGLARFIFSRSHIRPSDGTIKSNAFIPPPNKKLSVTRHRDATEDEVWGVGKSIAIDREKTLRGRGDVVANTCLERGLAIRPDPVLGHATLPDNPNHANVVGWPEDDPVRQKMFAIEIAAQAKLVRPPDYAN